MRNLLCTMLLACGALHAQVITFSVDYVKPQNSQPVVFLSGISQDGWRGKFIQQTGVDRFVYIDPTDALPQDRQSLRKIRWEEAQIDNADAFVLWIPKGRAGDPKTLSLKTLFECGRFSEMKKKPLLIGIEQGYVMRDSLVEHLKQIRSDVIITDSLEALSRETEKVVKKAAY